MCVFKRKFNIHNSENDKCCIQTDAPNPTEEHNWGKTFFWYSIPITQILRPFPRKSIGRFKFSPGGQTFFFPRWSSHKIDCALLSNHNMQCIHSQGVHQPAYLLRQGKQEDLKGGFTKISQRHQFEFAARVAVVAFMAVLNCAGYRVRFRILTYFPLDNELYFAR